MVIPSPSSCFSGIVTLYFFLLLGSLVLHTLASPRLHYCRHDPRDALLEFKHEFPVTESKPSQSLSSWNKSSDCCFWTGITCDAKSGEVISLDLNYVPLNNSLKPNSALFKLQQLKNLTLSDCHLYGEITSSLGNLSRLTHLDLSSNQLTGEVLVPRKLGFMSSCEDGENKWRSYAYNLAGESMGVPRRWMTNMTHSSLQAISYGSNSVSCSSG